jgi:hypothetical protein
MESTSSDSAGRLSDGHGMVIAAGGCAPAGHAQDLPGRDEEGARPAWALPCNAPVADAGRAAAGRAPHPMPPAGFAEPAGSDPRPARMCRSSPAGTDLPRSADLPWGGAADSTAPAPSEGQGPVRSTGFTSSVTVTARVAAEVRRRRDGGDVFADIVQDLAAAGIADLSGPIAAVDVYLGRAQVVP